MTKEHHFSGKLSYEKNEIVLSFKTSIDKTGTLKITFPRLRLSKKTRFILDAFHIPSSKPENFSLIGVGKDNTRFKTDHLLLLGLKQQSTPKGAWITPSYRASMAVFHTNKEEKKDKPELIVSLRGFEAFHQLKTTCPLGEVLMAGTLNPKHENKIIGYLAIRGNNSNLNINDWKKEADELLKYVQIGMSFAAGTNLKSPIVQFCYENKLETTIYSQTTQRHPHWPTFHPLDRQEIFSSVVTSFFEKRNHLKDLKFALEWLSMDADYTEVRLVNAMTGLENFLNVMLVGTQQIFLKPEKFKRMRQALGKEIEKYCRANQIDETTQHQVAAKLLELNRRTLKEKIYAVITALDVPMNEIKDEAINEAVRARNSIIHAGRYYQPGTKQVSLWTHVMTIRELLVRMVLAKLNFKGNYESYLGSHHRASFR